MHISSFFCYFLGPRQSLTHTNTTLRIFRIKETSSKVFSSVSFRTSTREVRIGSGKIAGKFCMNVTIKSVISMDTGFPRNQDREYHRIWDNIDWWTIFFLFCLSKILIGWKNSLSFANRSPVMWSVAYIKKIFQNNRNLVILDLCLILINCKIYSPDEEMK